MAWPNSPAFGGSFGALHPTVTLDFDEYNRLAEALGSAPEVFARALQSSLSSGAYWLRKRLIEAVQSNRLGWAPLRQYTPTGGTMRAILAGNPTGNFPLFGALLKTIVYAVDKPNLRAEIGVLKGTFGKKTVKMYGTRKKVPNVIGESAQDSARAFQGGMTRQVTPAMRRYFWSIGMGLGRNTTQLKAPERPLFAPVFEQDVAAMKQLMMVAFADKLTNGFTHRDVIGG